VRHAADRLAVVDDAHSEPNAEANAEDFLHAAVVHTVNRARMRVGVWDAYRVEDPNGKRRQSEAPEQRQERREKAAAWRKIHRWTPNQLRYAAATSLRREFGIEAAQVVRGPSNANVTQIYAERDADRAKEIAKKVG